MLHASGTHGVLLAFWILVLGCAPPTPDLVLVTFDTLRLDHVGAYAERDFGSRTPHLDEIAARGHLFESAWSPMPTTAPAHASLFTGLRPREHGVQRNGDRARSELAGQALAARLRNQGYATGAFVTSHVFRDRMGLPGFDEWDMTSDPVRPGTAAAESALAWLDGVPRPFFLWLHLYDPHAPYGSAEEKLENYPIDLTRYGWVDPARYADPRERFQMGYRYGQGVSAADQALGALMKGLADRGLEPFVAITADHGESLDEHLESAGFAYSHGALLTPEALRIPLVLAGPGVEPARAPEPVELRDLYPTLLARAGIADTEAHAADRHDLLGELPSQRVIEASRRVFESKDSRLLALGAQALEQIRAHAVALSDGERLLVIGSDGTPLTETDEGDPLLERARRALAADLVSRQDRLLEPLDADTRASLEALGYLE